MKETISILVICENTEKMLEFVYQGDVITLKFDGKDITSFDFTNNFLPAIERMIEIWE